MKYKVLFCFLFSISISSFAADLVVIPNYWECSTLDANNKQWKARNFYKKMALMNVLSFCKKNSLTPASCKSKTSICELYINGVNTTPQWQCIALDWNATMWSSNSYSSRDDAALAAKDYCRSRSPFPASCYINMITCRNTNELRNI